MNHKTIKIFVEGADTHSRKDFENAFLSVFREILPYSNPYLRVMIVASGGRPDCYIRFAQEFKSKDRSIIPILLIDSESKFDFDDPLNSAKKHIHAQEQFKNIKNDALDDDRFYLMTTAMESWILSDTDAILRFFKDQNLTESQLSDIEQKLKSFVTACTKTDDHPKGEIEKLFKSLCQEYLKKSYKKTSHSFEMLKFVKPDAALEKSRSFSFFYDGLRQIIEKFTNPVF